MTSAFHSVIATLSSWTVDNWMNILTASLLPARASCSRIYLTHRPISSPNESHTAWTRFSKAIEMSSSALEGFFSSSQTRKPTPTRRVWSSSACKTSRAMETSFLKESTESWPFREGEAQIYPLDSGEIPAERKPNPPANATCAASAPFGPEMNSMQVVGANKCATSTGSCHCCSDNRCLDTWE